MILQELNMAEVIGQPDYSPELADRRWYMIAGEVFEMSPVNRVHGWLASRINAHLTLFVEVHDLGEVHIEVGYNPPGDPSTLLVPDVSFVSKSRLSQVPDTGFVPFLPDLAVEVVSPSNSILSIRRKAAIYLANGARLVWIVLPDQQGVDVCRSAVGARLDIEFVGADGLLSGEDVLPGFELNLSRLFPNPQPS